MQQGAYRPGFAEEAFGREIENIIKDLDELAGNLIATRNKSQVTAQIVDVKDRLTQAGNRYHDRKNMTRDE